MDSPQRRSSAPLGQSLCPLHCRTWGRHSLVFPQGNWPRGHTPSLTLLACSTEGKDEDDHTPNHIFTHGSWSKLSMGLVGVSHTPVVSPALTGIWDWLVTLCCDPGATKMGGCLGENRQQQMCPVSISVSGSIFNPVQLSMQRSFLPPPKLCRISVVLTVLGKEKLCFGLKITVTASHLPQITFFFFFGSFCCLLQFISTPHTPSGPFHLQILWFPPTAQKHECV